MEEGAQRGDRQQRAAMAGQQPTQLRSLFIRRSGGGGSTPPIEGGSGGAAGGGTQGCGAAAAAHVPSRHPLGAVQQPARPAGQAAAHADSDLTADEPTKPAAASWPRTTTARWQAEHAGRQPLPQQAVALPSQQATIPAAPPWYSQPQQQPQGRPVPLPSKHPTAPPPALPPCDGRQSVASPRSQQQGPQQGPQPQQLLNPAGASSSGGAFQHPWRQQPQLAQHPQAQHPQQQQQQAPDLRSPRRAAPAQLHEQGRGPPSQQPQQPHGPGPLPQQQQQQQQPVQQQVAQPAARQQAVPQQEAAPGQQEKPALHPPQQGGAASGPMGGGMAVQRRGARQPLRLRLAEWGLPPGVVQAFEAKGVRSMYPWQAAALECGEQGQNLVYCAPTSGGKSLVAEVLMVRRLMLSLQHIPQPRRSKPKYGRALVVLPYVSIVSEKAEHLAQVLAPMHAAVKGFFGAEEKGQALAPRGETVACCTIEKANVAINRLAQEGRLGELCCVVVDELHMVGDGERGVGLEMSLSKLLFSPAARHVQIIGMSATMGGLEHLRAWLHAELFLTNFRPVPLAEHAVFRGKVYEKIGPQELATLEEGTPPLREVREVAPSDPRRDADRLVPLVAEVTQDGHSVLVFCSTRKACEAAAALIADILPQISPTPEPERAAELAAQRQSICQDVKVAMGGAMSAALEACMLQGVAWHHAGLTAEERSGVERAYRCGAVTVITATSTLAAGVNLPARRVILRSLHQGIGPVARSQYLQMVGRAGRAGHSAVGESFLIGKGAANGQEWHQICGLLTAPVPCLESRLLALEASGKPAAASGAVGRASGGAPLSGAASGGGAAALTPPATQHLQQLLLEGVANGTVREGADVGRLVCSTLAAQQQGMETMRAASKMALRALMEQKRLVQGQPGMLELTPKGRAVYDSALPLEAAMQLYDSCKHADHGFMLDSPLVLLYHCLLSHPFQIVSWAEWGRALASLNKQEQHIAESVGVHIMHVHAAQSGRTPSADVQERHSKFAAAVALSELTQEKDIQAVVAKWGREGVVSKAGLSRGQVQKLQQDAGKWMGMASLLCESAGWWPLATLYANLSQMAAAGVRQDLLPLMRIPGMDAGKARALYKAGLRDAQMLATADEQAVARAVAPAIAAQMRGRSSAGKQAGGVSAASAANYAAASMSARAASTLVKEARDHLRRQMAELATLVEDIREDEAAEVVACGGGGAVHAAPGGDPWPAAASGLQRQLPAIGGGAAAGVELSAEELAQIRREVAQLGDGAGGQAGSAQQAAPDVSIPPAAQLVWTQGTIKVTELRPRTPAQQLGEFFELWGAQPRFALALHTLSDEELAAAAAGLAAGPPPVGASGRQRPGSAGASAAPAQRLQGLAVCWDLRQAFFLELTAAHCQRVLHSHGGPGGSGGTTVLDAVRAVLAQATQKICYGALESLPELMQHGVRLGGSLEDPRLAGALLWPGAAEEGGASLDLKRMHAAVAPEFKARVPNLCRSGVTATCRAAVLSLACAEPLKRLLAQRRMLEAFLLLESPAALALLHINASPAAPRLAPPALAAALAQAQQCAGRAQCAVRQLYGMPQLDLDSTDTLLQLLGSLKQPLPERPKRGRPTVSLDHLQELLRRCRPHQAREREVLTLLLQHRAISEQVAKPLQALLEVSALAAAPGAPAPGSHAAQQRPGSASGDAAHPAAEPGACSMRRQGPAVLLQLGMPAGQMTYGPFLDRQLSALLSAPVWCPFSASGCQASVHEELARGSLTAEAVAAAAASGPGLPVVLHVPRHALLSRGVPAVAAEPGSGAASGEAGMPADPFDGDSPPEEEQEVWVAGVLRCILGKRLRTYLDFGAEQAPSAAAQHDPGGGGDGGSQRVSLGAVRVALLPDGDSRLGSAAGSSACTAAPRTLELRWPCNQLWRLAGPAAALLGGAGCTGGISCCSLQQQQQGAQQQLAPAPPLEPTVSWGLQGYCAGGAAFAAAAFGGAAADSLQHKPTAAAQQEQQEATPGSALLLRLDQLHAELAVLAHLSGQPELQQCCAEAAEAASSGATQDAYQRLGHCWAAAAGRLDVPGSGGHGSPPVLVCGGTAAALVHSLVHGWSPRKLGWVLRCPKHAAGLVLDSFLAAFPALRAWLAETAAAGEAACSATTLAGRQRQFAAPKRADDAMGRGKLHKAILQHVLAGSLAELIKAALVAVHAALASLGPPASAGAGAASAPHSTEQQRRRQQQGQQEGPGIVLALGSSMAVHLPAGFVAAHGDGMAAASAAAGAVQQALRSLRVGRVQLAAPLAMACSAGPSLHPLAQQPVLASGLGAGGSGPAQQQQYAGGG